MNQEFARFLPWTTFITEYLVLMFLCTLLYLRMLSHFIFWNSQS